MKVQGFLFFLVSLTFFASFESGSAAMVPLPRLLRSLPMFITDGDKERLEARCPPLDPCKVGNEYMERFENIRKSVHCPPQPQRCPTVISRPRRSDLVNIVSNTRTTTTVAQLASAEPSLELDEILLCQYLKSNFGNKVFLKMYVEILKSTVCRNH